MIKLSGEFGPIYVDEHEIAAVAAANPLISYPGLIQLKNSGAFLMVKETPEEIIILLPNAFLIQTRMK